jgi:outer membrane protein TolC
MLASARARIATYDALNLELAQDLARIAVLRAHGRIGEADALAALAAGEELERRRSLAREEALEARLALALAAGLADDHPALEAVKGAALASFDALAEDLPDQPPTDAELERHPRVRELRRRFELAEADVRRGVALAWPTVGLGPMFTSEGFGVDDMRIGGVLRLSLPFPSRWRGVLDAALERRAGIIAAFEDELLALELRAAKSEARAAEVRARAGGPSHALAVAATEGWRATHTSFRVGRTDPLMWRDMAVMQLEHTLHPIDEAELLALATLDVIEARGPFASPYAAVLPTRAIDPAIDPAIDEVHP